jgi:CubicO group peptidase (beta-lactamase class C family)
MRKNVRGLIRAILIPTVALWAFSLSVGLFAQSAAKGSEERAARIEKGLLPNILIEGRTLPPMTLADRMDFYKVPGVSVAVINDGAVDWAKGYGLAETGTAAPVTPRTLFQAASLSKSLTAMAALRLVEMGKLALDQDVNTRLTSWKVPENEFTKVEKVTLRRLLSHTAGLTVSGFGGYPADAPVPTLIQVLDGQKPANSAAIRVDILPGSRNRYSGGGFTVAQQMMIDVTRKPFPALLSEMVLKPLGMGDSTYEQPLPADRRGTAAGGHSPDGKLLPGRYHTYPEMAAAGLWTTPTDLARFLIEMQKALQGRSDVLTAASARSMTTPVKAGYGLGLGLDGSGPGASFGHGGSNEGFRCQMTAFLEGGRGAVVMTNGDQGSALVMEIIRAVAHEYGWPAFHPKRKKIVAVDPAALAVLTGRYQLRPGKTIDVVLEGGTLFIVDGKERIELFPEAETRFFALNEEDDIAFHKGPDGKVDLMLVGSRIKAPKAVEK